MDFDLYDSGVLEDLTFMLVHRVVSLVSVAETIVNVYVYYAKSCPASVTSSSAPQEDASPS